MKTGRNERCPCGSGKKYKNCHAEQRRETTVTDRMGWIVVAIVAVGAISLFASLRGGSDEPTKPATAPLAPRTAAPAAPATPTPQPPGPVPAGKVWSPEHGHWHDKANSSQIQLSTSSVPSQPAGGAGGATPSPTPGTPVAQPPGPAPSGKVWSAEHGHWHDAPGASGASAIPAELQPLMKPPGVPATPAGAVWSEEHKHWHDAKEEAKRKAAAEQGTTPTPQPAPNPDKQ